jgi:hypothetical protein
MDRSTPRQREPGQRTSRFIAAHHSFPESASTRSSDSSAGTAARCAASASPSPSSDRTHCATYPWLTGRPSQQTTSHTCCGSRELIRPRMPPTGNPTCRRPASRRSVSRSCRCPCSGDDRRCRSAHAAVRHRCYLSYCLWCRRRYCWSWYLRRCKRPVTRTRRGGD